MPKRRRNAIFGQIGRTTFHALAKQKERQIVGGYLRVDYVHMCIAIPRKHSVASVIGFLEGRA